MNFCVVYLIEKVFALYILFLSKLLIYNLINVYRILISNLLFTNDETVLRNEQQSFINAPFEDRKCCNDRQAQRVFVPLD